MNGLKKRDRQSINKNEDLGCLDLSVDSLFACEVGKSYIFDALKTKENEMKLDR